jgi:hypothetical protein
VRSCSWAAEKRGVLDVVVRYFSLKAFSNESYLFLEKVTEGSVAWADRVEEAVDANGPVCLVYYVDCLS